MPKSLLLNVTTVAFTDIVVQTVCTKIVVLEDGGGQSTKTQFKGYSQSGVVDANPVTLAAGVGLEFPKRARPYQPGEVIGSIQCADVNATYGQIET